MCYTASLVPGPCFIWLQEGKAELFLCVAEKSRSLGMRLLCTVKVAGCLCESMDAYSCSVGLEGLCIPHLILSYVSLQQWHYVVSLVPRPPFAAYFAAAEKRAFFHGCEKSCEGRPGYEANYIVYWAVDMGWVGMLASCEQASINVTYSGCEDDCNAVFT